MITKCGLQAENSSITRPKSRMPQTLYDHCSSEDLRNKESLFELDLDFSAIRVYVPTIELLACCKIFSTREKDLIDLKETPILEKCDTEKLLEMVAEYREYLLNPSNRDLNLYELDNILKEKGIL